MKSKLPAFTSKKIACAEKDLILGKGTLATEIITELSVLYFSLESKENIDDIERNEYYDAIVKLIDQITKVPFMKVISDSAENPKTVMDYTLLHFAKERESTMKYIDNFMEITSLDIMLCKMIFEVTNDEDGLNYINVIINCTNKYMIRV